MNTNGHECRLCGESEGVPPNKLGRLHPTINLPADTPAKMVAIFQAARAKASAEMRTVYDGLIGKWREGEWHAATFHFLHTDGYGCGVKVQSWAELHRLCVFI